MRKWAVYILLAVCLSGCGQANGNKQGDFSNDTVADSVPAEAIGLKKQGNDFFDKGDYNAAMECYIKAIKVYPKYDTINFKTMKSQEKYTIIKKFDIESYKKKRDTDINFTDRDGMLVRQWSGENELDGKYYIDERHYPNSPYLYCIEYDEKGRIKNFITNFYNIIIGKIIYYNTFGSIVKEVDEDAPYKFSINDLIVKMKCEYNMLIEDKNKVWNVGRYIEDLTPLYVISEKNGDFHENLYLINGYNGKTLYIKKDSYRDVDSDNIYTEEELNETLYQEYKRVKKIK